MWQKRITVNLVKVKCASRRTSQQGTDSASMLRSTSESVSANRPERKEAVEALD